MLPEPEFKQTVRETVKIQVETLIARLREILGADLIGIYLHGSLAMGCFNPSKSDLDLLVVTRADLTPHSRSAVTQTLLTLSNSPTPVELSVIQHADLHPWRHPCPYIFHYSEDWREKLESKISRFSESQNQAPCEDDKSLDATHPGDPDLAGHITVLHARGQVLYGAPIAEVFPEIPRADFLDSILGDVLSPEYGLTGDTASPTYLILNACRALAYLRGGGVLSKAEGGLWALENIPAQFQPVVQAALTAYRSAGEIQISGLEAFKTWMLVEIGNL